ncbi:MAG TPA: hypothetical protein VJH55_01170 [Candidatus Paceibacterota bacterium]
MTENSQINKEVAPMEIGPLKIVYYSSCQYAGLSRTQRTKKQRRTLEKLDGRKKEEYEFLKVWLYKGVLYLPVTEPFKRGNAKLSVISNVAVIRSFHWWSTRFFVAPTGWCGGNGRYHDKSWCLEDVKVAGYEKTKRRPKFFLRTMWQSITC